MTHEEYIKQFEKITEEHQQGYQLVEKIKKEFKENIDKSDCLELCYCVGTDDNKLTDGQVVKFISSDKDPKGYSFEMGDIVIISKELEPMFYEVDKQHDLMILTPVVFLDRETQIYHLGYPFILPDGKYVMGTLGTNKAYYSFDVVGVVIDRISTIDYSNIDTAIQVKKYCRAVRKLALEYMNH